MTDATDARRRHPFGRRMLVGFGIGVAGLVVVALVAAIFVRLPYVVTSPGPVTPLDDDVLAIDGAATYDHDGAILFLTVTQTRKRPNVYRVLRGWLDDSMTVQPEDDVLGDESPADTLRLNVLLMRQSQIAAKAAALTTLGYEVETTPGGALVRGLAPDGPARDALRIGDVITAVDGVVTTTAGAVGEAIRAGKPGDDVLLDIERSDDDRGATHEEITIRSDERDGEPFIGVLLTSYLAEPDFPVEITLDTREVSGPSAGLAFALAIVNDLSPGDLTAGEEIAVTGTVDADGTVGPVGGIEQKTVGARRAGASLLLVPEDEADEARRHAGSLPVVGVATIADAISALVEAGGAPPRTAPASLAA